MEQNFQFCKPFFHCLGPNGEAEAQKTKTYILEFDFCHLYLGAMEGAQFSIA